MTTNFFERQSKARRSTKWLVAMFVLAVVGIVGAVAAVAAAIVLSTNDGSEPPDMGQLITISLAAGGATLALIVLGSLYKVAALSGGGTTVAEAVGGRRIHTNTSDPVEKRILNIVEEMALASGVPVPPVYLLADEKGINAFAAGYSPSDAVVAVTRGTVEQLTRDQLQGVVAHEFSHILNGDMRLNIRLIGILHGILLLGLVGQIVFRIAAYSGRGSRNSKNSGAIYLVLIGLGMVILGFLGTLMGGLIKAAVSRQREYLADASAVQFTRNPSGIAGALKRIGAAVFGSKIEHPNAAEFSHMYFGQGVRAGFSGLMATHPPLESRIARLDPEWDGKYPPRPDTPSAFVEIASAAGLVGASLVGDRVSADVVPADVVDAAANQVGNPTEIHRTYVHELVERLPETIVAAVHEPYGARAVIFALLLDRDKAVRNLQMETLTRLMPPDVVKLTRDLGPAVDGIDVRGRLPLVDMSLPALRAMAPPQYREFSQAFQQLVEADNRIALFEWTLHRVLLRHLRPQFESAKPPRVSYYALTRLGGPCSVLLSVLAYAGNSPDKAAGALAAAAAHLPQAKIKLLPPRRAVSSSSTKP
ncbi:MAG: M48 family metallopeptidase [Planctomycetes bacterium]|nr:M48 family metallopeptidase [Planctomycetota bacterium]